MNIYDINIYNINICNININMSKYKLRLSAEFVAVGCKNKGEKYLEAQTIQRYQSIRKRSKSVQPKWFKSRLQKPRRKTTTRETIQPGHWHRGYRVAAPAGWRREHVASFSALPGPPDLIRSAQWIRRPSPKNVNEKVIKFYFHKTMAVVLPWVPVLSSSAWCRHATVETL